jgi:hypothetical protein
MHNSMYSAFHLKLSEDKWMFSHSTRSKDDGKSVKKMEGKNLTSYFPRVHSAYFLTIKSMIEKT